MSQKKGDRKRRETRESESIFYNTPDGAARVEVFFLQRFSFECSCPTVISHNVYRLFVVSS